VHQISTAIVDIIEESRQYCFLVTPYYKPWALLDRALEKANKNQKKVIFFLRKDSTDSETIKYLNIKMGFDVVLVERLHTKLYFNETKALITSMNLYDSSKEFNYELGYLLAGYSNIKKLKEKIIEDDLLTSESNISYPGRYLESLKVAETEKLEAKRKIGEMKYYHETENNQSKTYYMGYCIRCKKSQEINKNYPLCTECYSVWSQFMNGDYEEKYCHRCGKDEKVTKNQPFCRDCREQLNRNS
jgi:phosphatidylserine/phosphatidylglycerophosphate/cardiolipin synthase-like enzyme